MGSKRTKLQLSQLTDYRGFEAFCHDLMAMQGFTTIDPLGGSGDKGRDAIFVSRADNRTTIFAYSVEAKWESKLQKDLAKVRQYGHKCDEVIFVTTAELSAGNIDRVKARARQEYGWDLDIYHLERIATLVDATFPVLKRNHPGVFFLDATPLVGPPGSGVSGGANHIDKSAYASRVKSAFNEWHERYTSLLAHYREMEILATASRGSREVSEAPVLQLPMLAPIVVLLGESGSGKTTALWRIALEYATSLEHTERCPLPVILPLRNWSQGHGVIGLIEHQFSQLSVSPAAIATALEDGQLLILIDGLNELPHDYQTRDSARRDIHALIGRYPKNRFVITCRTPDYDPKYWELSPVMPNPAVFEIERLSRDQVTDYTQRFFRDLPAKSEAFLEQLDLSNDDLWAKKSSFVHLARVPLHLQIMLVEFDRTGLIPQNKGRIVDSLLAYILERDRAGRPPGFGPAVSRRILGRIAVGSVTEGYYLTVPVLVIRTMLADELKSLYADGLLSQPVSEDAAWREIASSNIFATRGPAVEGQARSMAMVEWLHQLVLDYFLASELIQALLRPRTEASETTLRCLHAKPSLWPQPCVITLGLVDTDHGAMLLRQLVSVSPELAAAALDGQDRSSGASIADALILRLTSKPNWDPGPLRAVAYALPFTSVADALFSAFKRGDTYSRELLAMAICEFAIEHSGKEASTRAQQRLDAMIGNTNETVRFYAAKGLWSRDRGRASATLRELHDSTSQKVRDLVLGLAEEWGIE